MGLSDLQKFQVVNILMDSKYNKQMLNMDVKKGQPLSRADRILAIDPAVELILNVEQAKKFNKIKDSWMYKARLKSGLPAEVHHKIVLTYLKLSGKKLVPSTRDKFQYE